MTVTMREKISQDEVRHVANLARLELDERDEMRMTEQMNNILTYVDKLNQLDTGDVSPTTHAIPNMNVFRPDAVRQSLDREQSLANAPRSDGASFVVPKVI
jgi:aspartyl-tRNA(Asn)/glutamyl-tRNA(Gln) amidotransferase subunit C